MSNAESLFYYASELALAPVRVAGAVGGLAVDLEQRLERSVTEAAEELLLNALDGLVASMLSERVIDRMLERAEAAGVAQRVADRLLDDGIAEQIATRALSGPELQRMLTTAFKSALPEELAGQLLASEAVWILVDEIARSPSVTQAIAHQSSGFLDEVAGKARDRSRHGDAVVQRLAHRLTHPREERRPTGGTEQHAGRALWTEGGE